MTPQQAKAELRELKDEIAVHIWERKGEINNVAWLAGKLMDALNLLDAVLVEGAA